MLDLTKYEALKQGDKEIECDKCKATWKATQTQILNQAVKNEYNQNMMVYYFVCPKCGEIYIVSILDFKTRALLEKSQKLQRFIQRRVAKQTDVSSTKEELERVRQLLLQRQQMLKNKYGKHFYLRKEEATTANVE